MAFFAGGRGWGAGDAGEGLLKAVRKAVWAGGVVSREVESGEGHCRGSFGKVVEEEEKGYDASGRCEAVFNGACVRLWALVGACVCLTLLLLELVPLIPSLDSDSQLLVGCFESARQVSDGREEEVTDEIAAEVDVG